MAEKVKLTSREQDYSQWYLDVAQTGELFEYSPTPGCITFLPKSTDIWQRIRAHMDAKIRVMGVQNIMLPMLVPMEFFMKEADHVEGFAPEIATVTRVGDKELDQPLGLRPTSETMFCDFFKKRLKSYRDLPLLYNQWANIVRWEKRTRPFLRTAEFHWQEGHTLHRTRDEAWEFVLRILNDVYIDTIKNLLAIDGIAGRKSESEKFAGGDITTTFEPMMSNGWALQICTSHLLAQGFMEGFDVQYTEESGTLEYPHYTSWGLSTRSIGGVISSHSDDRGLIIPPKVSEYLAVILPIYGRDRDAETTEYARRVASTLIASGTEVPVKGESFRAIVNENARVLLDLRNERVGMKITDWELSGYPIRIECGAREMDEWVVTVVSRITLEKITVPLAEVAATVGRMLDEGQSTLLARSTERLRANTVPCHTLEEVGAAVEAGKFALYAWDLDPEFEKIIKERWKATTRCLPFDGQFTDELLPVSDPKLHRVIVARAF